MKMKNSQKMCKSAGLLFSFCGWPAAGKHTVWSRNRCILYAVLLTSGYTAAVSAVFPWVYILNDDRFMKEVLSGVYNGVADAHVIFIKYPLAVLIRNLYRSVPGWDWYGIVLVGISLTSLCLILYRVLRVWQTWKGKALLTGVVLAVYTAAWLPRLLAFTYTTVAAMAGATALFWYASGCRPENRISAGSDAVVTALLALLAYAIRDSVFMMMLPFAAVLFLNRLAGCRQENAVAGTRFRPVIRQMILPLVLGCLVLLVWRTDRQAYGGSEWERIRSDRAARSVIYNYCGAADYETHRDFYERAGIAEDTWQALIRYNLVVDEDLDTAHLSRIAAYSEYVYEESLTAAQKWRDGLRLAWDGAMKSGCQPLNWLAILLSGWMLCYGVVRKDRHILCTAVMLAAAALALWVVLGMGGRLPRRVAESLHLCVLLSMAGLYFEGVLAAGSHTMDAGRFGTENRTDRVISEEQHVPDRQRAGSGLPGGIRQKILCCCALLLLLLYLVDAYKWIGHITRQTMAGAENYQMVLDYCASHPDLFYLADVYSVVGYADEFTLQDETQVLNVLPLGDWLAFSPMYETRLAQQGITGLARDILTRDDIRILCRDYYDMEYLLSYYIRHGESAEMTVVDTIQQNGEAMDVYQFHLKQ